MLVLENVRKTYVTAGFSQTALDGVSMGFRDNEFVAILGPSGSGKTTLLNIIGGLDHYDSGNLIIDGIPTSDYSDRDWDAYRNNRIGFVFQSYNLIPHQTVLANVELALTLSGVDRETRRERAIQALTDVGLADHVHKLPSQLSGGQMQRVAIARALINDPEILLADEPTGALDSKTSVEVMALLTNIASDRLVIMVTHNPDLAAEYATRTVTLHDGSITTDTDPFDPAAEAEVRAAKPSKRTSMGFLTAISLSFMNLLTKKGRTLMTSFAGSIGIIGIAAILALANGVNAYIKSVEEDTLSLYPLSIYATGIDIGSMLGAATGDDSQPSASADPTRDPSVWANAEVREFQTMTRIFQRVGANDLASLKAFLDSPASGIKPYTNAIQYSYDLTPQIFSVANDKSVRQVNPNDMLSSLGMGSGASSSSLMSMFTSTDVFHALPSDVSLVQKQYDLVAGEWPKGDDELLLVLTSSGGLPDIALYAMGLRDPADFAEMLRKFANNEAVDLPTERLTFTYDEVMGITFKQVNAGDFYRYDATLGMWADQRADSAALQTLVSQGRTLNISGVVRASEDTTTVSMQPGLYYTDDLIGDVMTASANSQIVKSQMAHPDVNVFSGRTFAEEAKGDLLATFDFAQLISVDADALSRAFQVDPGALSFPSIDIDTSQLLASMPPIEVPDLMTLLSGVDLTGVVDQAKLAAVMGDILSGYLNELLGTMFPGVFPPPSPSPSPTAPPTVLPTVLPSIPTGDEIAASFEEYLNRPEVQAKLAAGLAGAIDSDQLQAEVSTALNSYMQSLMASMMTSVANNLESQLNSYMSSAMGSMGSQLGSALNISPETITGAFKFNMTGEQMSQLMTSLMNTSYDSYDSNLRRLGYATLEKPSQIDIYPIDFESKQRIVEILDGYNAAQKATGEDTKVITYTDLVGTLMTSVTDIIDKISMVLVAFVSISLVVSSIMIGVITYISVLERRKEIGILRAIGASKRDIANVFNAETLIVGAVAGAMGVGITLILAAIANVIIEQRFDIVDIARLSPTSGLVLIAVSMGLTFIAGLIPSSAASRSDPVESLRSE
ncbi:MAG: ABC transporter ATP-binding protein/permease [Propionibacteriaceae bacterium]|jgi:ABC-type lipoprotein export system ATPase subunit|nr:ABC transporter ATP-binding protein/permease [Propionibacteriaceae bacterium]